MSSKNLSRLEQVELRNIWQHEALDFTNWLALEENLALLGDEIGTTIKLIRTEANVGRYNVDILAEEEGTGRKIIIENQLEDTDHDHLGKIITYASGYDAEIIIWIVKDAREEHKRAVEWLNEHTDEKIGFFLLQIQVWKIGDSSPAPKFDIVASPNEWAKITKIAGGDGEISETKTRQLRFWTDLKECVGKTHPKLRLQTPRPQHWYDVSMGSSEAHIGLSLNSQKNLLSCELYISKNKELYGFLMERKEEIEREVGAELEWIDASVASRIILRKSVDSIFNKNKESEYFEWLASKTELFQKVFQKQFMNWKQSIQ